jgi:hypothetical protein
MGFVEKSTFKLKNPKNRVFLLQKCADDLLFSPASPVDAISLNLALLANPKTPTLPACQFFTLNHKPPSNSLIRGENQNLATWEDCLSFRPGLRIN